MRAALPGGRMQCWLRHSTAGAQRLFGRFCARSRPATSDPPRSGLFYDNSLTQWPGMTTMTVALNKATKVIRPKDTKN